MSENTGINSALASKVVLLGLACLGDLQGKVEYVVDLLKDPKFVNFGRLLFNEVEHTIPTRYQAQFYVTDLKARLGLGYQGQILGNGSHMSVANGEDYPVSHVLTAAKNLMADGRNFDLSALTVAAWLKRTRGGTNEAGHEMIVSHPLAKELAMRGQEGFVSGSSPLPQLGVESLFGDLSKNELFVATVGKYLRTLDEKGVTEAMDMAVMSATFRANLAPAAVDWLGGARPSGNTSADAFRAVRQASEPAGGEQAPLQSGGVASGNRWDELSHP